MCRLACGDYGDYVETVHTPQKGETGARTPVPPRTKRRDDLSTYKSHWRQFLALFYLVRVGLGLALGQATVRVRVRVRVRVIG